MKQIKTIIVLAIFFSLSARSFSQTPDRVLSAEEFRQQKIEEKRQQLKREIQIRMNDRMKYGYSYGIPDEYIFLGKTYPYKEHKRIFEGENNELKYIFNACDEDTKKMFFIDFKRFFYIYENHPNGNINWKKLKFEHTELADKIRAAFNGFLMISPENREKVAQAIRDYRLAEFIKNELSDIEAERNISTGNYRFIGFTAGFGFATAVSDKYNYYEPEAGPAMIFDVNFRYAYLYRRNNNLQIGFIVDVGIWSEFANQQLFHPGFDILFGAKYKRFLFGIGGYFYLISPFQKQKYAEFKSTSFKKIDIGLMLSMNFLLGSRMNYLLGIDMRINLNKRIITKNITTGEIIDETGHTAIFIKFGYGF